MDNSEVKEACSNCNILLPESKIGLHEAYCIRNCIKCEECGQFYSRDEMPLHKEEAHLKKQEISNSENILPPLLQQNQLLKEDSEISKNQLLVSPQLSKEESYQVCSLQQKHSSARIVENGKARCLNCSKAIVESQIDMHENFCFKNCVKCPYCPEFLIKDMIEEHIQETHVKCKFCNKRIDINLRDAHQQVCQKGGRVCSFCSVVFPIDKFEEHQEYCGGTTDNCLYCFKYILKKEINLHDKICIMKNENQLLPPLIKHQSVVKEDPNKFKTYLTNEIKKYCEQCNISIGQAIYLLDEYGWDFSNAQVYPQLKFQQLLDTQKEALKKGAGLNDCIVCLQKLETNQFYSLSCDHRACNDCYLAWINTQIKNGPKCLNTNCIFDECQEKVGPEGFEKFLPAVQVQKYWGFVQQSALASSTIYIMCPNVKCQTILQATQGEKFNIRKKQFNVYCYQCQSFFCNLCKEEAHKPLQCSAYSKFKQNKSQLQNNQYYRQFYKLEGQTQVLKTERPQMLEKMFLKINQFSTFNQMQKHEYYEFYRKAYSLLLEGSLINQWSQVLKIYDLYPTPIVEMWIDTNLVQFIQKLENLLKSPNEFNSLYFGELKDLSIEIEKLFKDILKEFHGKNQEIKQEEHKGNQEESKHEQYQYYDYSDQSDQEIDYEDYDNKQQNQEKEDQEKIVQNEQQEKKEQLEKDSFQNTLHTSHNIHAKSEQKCIECNDKAATMEGSLCDFCFDMIYSFQ